MIRNSINMRDVVDFKVTRFSTSVTVLFEVFQKDTEAGITGQTKFLLLGPSSDFRNDTSFDLASNEYGSTVVMHSVIDFKVNNSITSGAGRHRYSHRVIEILQKFQNSKVVTQTDVVLFGHDSFTESENVASMLYLVDAA